MTRGVTGEDPATGEDGTTGTVAGGVWQAMGRGPVRLLFSSWPWRATGYLLAGGVLGTGWLLLALALLVAGLLLLPVGIGALILLCVPVTAAGLARLERSRLLSL
ncbi:hypothetical protein G5C65_37765, partial [Streptomyces sp. SB3404]|nr:hypothetical protein [Streptomyces boncukensis]